MRTNRGAICGFLALSIVAFGAAKCARKSSSSSADAPLPAHDVEAIGLAAVASVFFAAYDIADDATKKAMLEQGLSPNTRDSIQLRYSMRGDLAALVKRWPDDKKRECLGYAQKNIGAHTEFAGFIVEGFGASPDFPLRGDAPSMRGYRPATATNREALQTLLKWAVRDGGVDAFTKTHWSAWKELDPDEAETADMKARVLWYLRLTDPTLPRFDVMLDPFLGPTNGFGAAPAPDSILLLVGPTDNDADRDVLLSHEYTHFPLSRIIERSDKLKHAIEDSACIYDSVKDANGYDGWPNYLRENLCRAISYRIAHVPDRDTGFVFEGFFGTELRGYESGQIPFDEFLTSALGRLRAKSCSH